MRPAHRQLRAHAETPDSPVRQLLGAGLQRSSVDPDQALLAGDDQRLPIGTHRGSVAAELFGFYVHDTEDATRLAVVELGRTHLTRRAAANLQVRDNSHRPIGCV